MTIDKTILAKAEEWLHGGYDKLSMERVKWLIDNDLTELNESFYRGLEFGTGGMRGIMGVGTNRMNVYTVGMATQGLANYLKKNFEGREISVAVAHDSRNNSRLFAETVADIFAANGVKVFLFDSLRPTPELSFAIRQLGCQSGVVVTASHNPKEYNGYKAYWDDGAQVTAPHDKNIIDEVNAISSMSQVRRGGPKELIEVLDERFDEIYLDRVAALSLSPEAVDKHAGMTIVYTPLHGSGVILVPAALKRIGFKNVHTVREQNIIDGDFPTVKSPNPEERTAMTMALELGREVDAEIIFATDPDADRLGIAVKDDDGNFILLNGNQIAVFLTYYMCRRWSELGRIDGRQYVVKTIVTTEMMACVAESFDIEYFDCLTGFKYIAEIIRNNEGKKQYVCGGEESFGFLPCDFVRDKDAVCSVSLAAEAAAWAKEQGMTVYQLLKGLYLKYGFYREGMVSVVREGQRGQQEIAQMMTDYRATPPHSICGSPVVEVRDYLNHENPSMRSNVLQFLTEDQTIVSVRPSGTEPKIKFYFGVREPLASLADYDAVAQKLDTKIDRIKSDLGL